MELTKPYAELMPRLDAIPGVGPRTVEVILAEIGPSVESWRRLYECHAGHPLEAARAQEKAAATERTTTMRLTALINAALAYSEAGDVDAAERLGRQVRDDASGQETSRNDRYSTNG